MWVSVVPLAAGILGAGAFVAVVARQWRLPSARPLVAAAVVLFAGVLTHALVHTPGSGALETALSADVRLLWASVAFSSGMIAAGLWFLFAVQYTGHGDRLWRPVVGFVVTLWMLFFGIAVLLVVGSPAGSNSEMLVGTLGGGLFFMAALATLGALLVLEAAVGRNAVELREAALLSAGALLFSFAPAVANNLERPVVYPVTVGLAGVLFAVAIRRFPVFDAPPVARVAGRDRLIEAVDDALLVLDREERIRDLNPAAEQVFETTRSTINGEYLHTLVSETVDPAGMATTGAAARVQHGETTLSLTVNRVTDARGRWFGYTLVCRDVTRHERRERRLRVLSRLLTGVVRDRMTVVAERTTALTGERSTADADGQERATESEALGQEVSQIVVEMKALVTTAREIERVLAYGVDGNADVGRCLRNTLDGTDHAIAVTEPDEPLRADVTGDVLETVFETLLGEANPGTVDELELRHSEQGPAIRLVSNPCQAASMASELPRTARESGELPAVELVRLVVEYAGGSVTVTETAGRQQLDIVLPGPGTRGGRQE